MQEVQDTEMSCAEELVQRKKPSIDQRQQTPPRHDNRNETMMHAAYFSRSAENAQKSRPRTGYAHQ